VGVGEVRQGSEFGDPFAAVDGGEGLGGARGGEN